MKRALLVAAALACIALISPAVAQAGYSSGKSELGSGFVKIVQNESGLYWHCRQLGAEQQWECVDDVGTNMVLDCGTSPYSEYGDVFHCSASASTAANPGKSTAMIQASVEEAVSAMEEGGAPHLPGWNPKAQATTPVYQNPASDYNEWYQQQQQQDPGC